MSPCPFPWYCVTLQVITNIGIEPNFVTFIGIILTDGKTRHILIVSTYSSLMRQMCSLLDEDRARWYKTSCDFVSFEAKFNADHDRTMMQFCLFFVSQNVWTNWKYSVNSYELLWNPRNWRTKPIYATRYTVWPKSKPLPNDQKIVFNLIKACQWD